MKREKSQTDTENKTNVIACHLSIFFDFFFFFEWCAHPILTHKGPSVTKLGRPCLFALGSSLGSPLLN
jgi:hypothetical protein